MKGVLHIIGAGQGDPELLTLKAYHVLTEETDVVAYPGSAPCTGTAKLRMPLVSGNEPVQIFPSEDFDLSFPGTLILLKVGRHLAQTKQKISDCGRTAYLIENCGLPGGASIPQLTGNAGENRLFFSDDRKIEKSLADTERGR